jgi:transposase
MLNTPINGGVKMTKSSNGRYSKEFRSEAVKLVVDGDISAYEAARQLSLPKSTLENWVRAFKAGKLSDIGGQQRPLTEVEQELDRVKRELAQVKQERDILKKAAAYFAKESLPGTR